MCAIADLINKVLWQCTVYFEGFDLRAEAQGWDTVYPHIGSHRHTNITYAIQAYCMCVRTVANGHLGLVLPLPCCL